LSLREGLAVSIVAAHAALVKRTRTLRHAPALNGRR
jgi:hypothetical protein